jgi:hypothetical protein
VARDRARTNEIAPTGNKDEAQQLNSAGFARGVVERDRIRLAGRQQKPIEIY